MKILVPISVSILFIFSTAASTCNKNEQLDSESICSENFTDLSDPSWVYDKIVELNGEYDDTRKESNPLIEIKRVSYNSAHGIQRYFIFKIAMHQNWDSNCLTTRKEVFRCEGVYEGEYWCAGSGLPNEEYAYSIGEGNQDFEVLWPSIQ